MPRRHRSSLSRRRSYRRRVKSSPCRKKGPAVCRSMKNCKFVSKKRRYCRKGKNTRRRSRGGSRRSHGGAKRLHHGGRKSRKRSGHRRRSGHRKGGFMSASSMTPFALTAALFAKKKKGMRK